MIKAVIFDVDGVLLDNTKVFLKVFREIGRRFDMKAPPDSEVKKLYGMPWYDILARMYDKSDAKMRETYIRLIGRYRMRKMKGMGYVLRNLKARKAIVTSKSRQSLDEHIGKFERFFEVIVTRDDTKRCKPDPEPLLLACRSLGIKPCEAVYIGDAIFDCQAAKAAGTKFIGFLSGATTKKQFKEMGVGCVGSLRELLEELQ